MGSQSQSGSSGHKAETHPGQGTFPWHRTLCHTPTRTQTGTIQHTDSPNVHTHLGAVGGNLRKPTQMGERAHSTQRVPLAGN